MNSLQWTHIMDKQPEHDESVVQVHNCVEDGFTIYEVNYWQPTTFQDTLDHNKKSGYPEPDFWWIRSCDFPLPFEIVKKGIRLTCSKRSVEITNPDWINNLYRKKDE